jgi:hypothetical protein
MATIVRSRAKPRDVQISRVARAAGSKTKGRAKVALSAPRGERGGASRARRDRPATAGQAGPASTQDAAALVKKPTNDSGIRAGAGEHPPAGARRLVAVAMVLRKDESRPKNQINGRNR